MPVLEVLPDGSYRSVIVNPTVHNQQIRARIVAAAAAGEAPDPDRAVTVRVVEYTTPDRPGATDRRDEEPIRLVTTIGDTAAARSYSRPPTSSDGV
jgi:hypothetical protein